MAGADGDNTATVRSVVVDGGHLPGRISRDNILVVKIQAVSTPAGNTRAVAGSTLVVGAAGGADSVVRMGDAEAKAEIS